MHSEEYLFYCDFEELELFPTLNLKWEAPSLITNSIIDIGGEVQHDFPTIFTQLEELGCKALQLRFFTKILLEEISRILLHIQKSAISSVEIILPYDEALVESDIITFISLHLRVDLIVFYSAPESKQIDHEQPPVTILFKEENLVDETHCGVISKAYFQLNLELFTEAQQYNSCLNRKISVDKLGNIKNCPSMHDSYGNIKEFTLAEVVSNNQFQSLWQVSKSQIAVCRDCEFRYICTDCRAYRTSEDIFAKPAKCNYNPYTQEWEKHGALLEID